MTDPPRYTKLVEWSDKDAAFVGWCPGVIGRCCHGPDEVEVYRQLCDIVNDWVDIARRDGRPLPKQAPIVQINQAYFDSWNDPEEDAAWAYLQDDAEQELK